MDSWKFIIEVHWSWSEFHGSDCLISGVFSGRTGIGRFSWALQDPARNHPPCREPHGLPVVHTCLFFYFCRVRFVLAVLWVEATGRRWYLMDGSDSFNVGLPVRQYPEVQAVGYCDKKRVRFCCQGLWSQPSSSEMDDLHSLSSAACFFWLGVHKLECMGKLEFMEVSGLDFPVRGLLSLRRSGHDAGFVWDRSYNPLLLWIEDTFSVGCSCLSRSTLWR